MGVEISDNFGAWMKLASIIQGTATVLLGVKLRRGKNFDPCLKGCEALNGSTKGSYHQNLGVI